MAGAPRFDGFIPGVWEIEAFGNGGFRFAGMSHRGSILALPTGIVRWAPERVEEITPAELALVLAGDSGVELLLIGTGAEMRPVAAGTRAALKARGIGCEFMTTAAAARTYNVLVAESRRVAAALVAVD